MKDFSVYNDVGAVVTRFRVGDPMAIAFITDESTALSATYSPAVTVIEPPIRPIPPNSYGLVVVLDPTNPTGVYTASEWDEKLAVFHYGFKAVQTGTLTITIGGVQHVYTVDAAPAFPVDEWTVQILNRERIGNRFILLAHVRFNGTYQEGGIPVPTHKFGSQFFAIDFQPTPSYKLFFEPVSMRVLIYNAGTGAEVADGTALDIGTMAVVLAF